MKLGNKSVKKWLQVSLFCLISFLLVACSGDDATNNETPVTESEETEEVAADENEDYDEPEDVQSDGSGEKIRISSLFPSDMPLPEDAELTLETTEEHEEEEKEARLSVLTSLTMDELEEMYEPVFNQEEYADDLEIIRFDDDGTDTVTYVVENDQYTFGASLFDYEDERGVTINMILYE